MPPNATLTLVRATLNSSDPLAHKSALGLLESRISTAAHVNDPAMWACLGYLRFQTGDTDGARTANEHAAQLRNRGSNDSIGGPRKLSFDEGDMVEHTTYKRRGNDNAGGRGEGDGLRDWIRDDSSWILNRACVEKDVKPVATCVRGDGNVGGLKCEAERLLKEAGVVRMGVMDKRARLVQRSKWLREIAEQCLNAARETGVCEGHG